MYRIEVSTEEVRLLQAALHAYLDDYGHDEAELLREVKALIAKLPRAPGHPGAGRGDQSAVTEL